MIATDDSWPHQPIRTQLTYIFPHHIHTHTISHQYLTYNGTNHKTKMIF